MHLTTTTFEPQVITVKIFLMRFGYHHLQKRAQSYTSLMAILHQDISGTGKRRFEFDTLLIWVNLPMY